MSQHYEWVLSLRLLPEVPAAFLSELRYHLGLSAEAPAEPTLDVGWPALTCGGDCAALPGGAAASLVSQQPYLNRPAAWGLFVRTFTLDDSMWDLMQSVTPWLARWALTEGWIGFAREELSLDPWVSFYAQQGQAYLAPPGEPPQPFNPDAPPFTLRQTGERWPPGPAGYRAANA
jgi:hypothetical protein